MAQILGSGHVMTALSAIVPSVHPVAVLVQRMYEINLLYAGTSQHMAANAEVCQRMPAYANI